MADTNAPSPSAPAQQDPLIGKVLDSRFTILERIGSGGMGRVYKARQAPLDRIVALKVLNPSYGGDKDPNFKRRFFLEASLTAKLKHPNTIQIIDYGEVGDELFYIAMEYLEGMTLSTLLTRQGALAWKRALNIAQQIARALREAHKAGIIHRDLKPANVMLVQEDNDHDLVKVLDFGLVKAFREDEDKALREAHPEMTQAGVILGSAQYMAPEQAHGQGDPRSDIYSLGVVLFHMLMGRPPFQARDSMDVIVQHHTQPPPRFQQLRPELEIPPEAEALVLRCLAKRPEGRFSSMDELLEALRQVGGLSNSGTISGLRTNPGNLRLVAPGSPSQVERPSQVMSPSGAISGARRLPPAPGMSGVHPAMSGVHPSMSGVHPAMSGAHRVKKPAASKGVMVAVGAFVAVLVAGGAVILLSRDARPASAGQTPAAAEAPATPTSAAEDEDALVSSKVVVVVTSMPSGASVTYRGKEVGVTPVQFSVGANKAGKARAEVTLSLAGYETATETVSGDGPTLTIQKQLERKVEQAAPARPSTPRTKNAGAYKEDPY